MEAFGIDISEHQRGWRPEDFAPWAFAILRARNEWDRDDREFWRHWAAAEGVTRRGIYGWPLAGAGPNANFNAGASLVRSFPGSEFGYWADVERSSRGLASVEEVEAYVRGIQFAGGHAGIYSNIYDLPRSPFLDQLPWWVAHYGPNDGRRHPLVRPAPPADRPWHIHQFTSRGGPGRTGLDVNYVPDLDTLLSLWGAAPQPPPRRKDHDMYIAIINPDGFPRAFLVSGSVILGEFPAEPRGFLAIPQAAIDFAGDRILIKNLTEFPGAWEALLAAQPQPPAPTPAPTPTPPPPVESSLLLEERLARLESALLSAANERRWSSAREVIKDALWGH